MNIQPVDFSGVYAAHALQNLRNTAPLVHCLTNDVVQSFTANVLLAVGSSPAMVVDPTEAAQFAAIADALLVNVGTFTLPHADAIRAAVQAANRARSEERRVGKECR